MGRSSACSCSASPCCLRPASLLLGPRRLEWLLTHLRPVCVHPNAVSAEDPLIYAVIANHSVPVQIEHTLAMLAMLVARQELVSGGGLDIPEIDRLAAEVDTRASTTVRDTLRSQGWRAAAQAISARSAAAGLPLAVTYSPLPDGRQRPGAPRAHPPPCL